MTTQKKHIAILCSRLDLPGGIERAVVNTANLFAKKEHSVTLVILDKTIGSFYPIDTRIKIIQQSLSFGITPEGNVITRKIRLFRDVIQLRKILKSLGTSHVISTEYPFTVASIIAGVKKRSRLFTWEHHHHAWLKKNSFWSFLCKKAYPKLHGVICLNKEEQDHYKKIATAITIPNFIENIGGKKTLVDNKTILSIGWLIPRKGIDILLQAAKIILHQHTDWKWKLIGDGVMKQQVLSFIEEESLQGRLVLQAPAGADLENEYLGSSLFVMTSRFEAFPMVLLEAMSFGVPCVSFNCPSGPADIITNNHDGLIVENGNTIELTTAISSLIADETRRIKMGENAFINVQRFSPEVIYDRWQSAVLTP